MSRYRISIVVLGLLLAGRPLVAAEFFVSPTGTDRGKGSQKAPWSLTKALSHPGVVKPGDTIWLRGGVYKGTFTSSLTGMASLPIKVRQYSGERATLDGHDGNSIATALSINGAYTWFMGFEVMNSSGNRTSPSADWPVGLGPGIDAFGVGTRLINLVIHDTGQGLGLWSTAVNGEAYGNIIYYNGFSAPDRGHGHAIYAQNGMGGSKLIKHNILGSGFDYNLHCYGSSGSAFLNSTVTENVFFQGPQLIGGKSGFDMAGTQMTGNYGWDAGTVLGYNSQHCNPTAISGNYFVNTAVSYVLTPPYDPLGRVGMTISGNTIIGDLDGFSQADYPNNTYYSKTNPPKADKVVVLPNAYEPGRATIVVYNWDGSATQAVDLTAVVSPGAAYEIRNAQNFFGPLVVSGTYSGGTVTLPMAGLTPATPVSYAAPPPTGPRFNVFVVLPARTASGTASKGQQEQPKKR